MYWSLSCVRITEYSFQETPKIKIFFINHLKIKFLEMQNSYLCSLSTAHKFPYNHLYQMFGSFFSYCALQLFHKNMNYNDEIYNYD